MYHYKDYDNVSSMLMLLLKRKEKAPTITQLLKKHQIFKVQNYIVLANMPTIHMATSSVQYYASQGWVSYKYLANNTLQ